MIIDDLKIDGFGVWHGLRVDHLSGQLNVFYGPNEAGKTTLLDFVRTVLYGFSAERRGRYLPPLHGGTGGGSLVLSTDEGPYEIARSDNGDGLDGQLCVTDDAGLSRPPSTLRELLRNLPEPVFNHVFALGLEELQELGTLSDAEVADRLFHLSTGLQGITLAQVLHELQVGRQRILAEGDQSGQLSQLLTEREKLRSELQELRKLTRRYADLLAERDGIDRSTAELEALREKLATESRLVELAIRIRPLWQRRRELDAALEGRTVYVGVGQDVVARFDAIKHQLRQGKHQLQAIAPEVDRLQTSLAEMQVNDALWRQGPRIEMLCDQQEWMTTLENQLGAAELEVADLETQQKRLAEQIGWRPGEAGTSLAAPPRSLAVLRPVAGAQRQAKADLKAARQLAERQRESSTALGRQIAAALAGREETELAAALENSGNRVNQLRRRVQLDERIDQLQQSRHELTEDNRELRGREMLPPRTLLILASVFAVGVSLLLAAILAPSSWTGGHGLALGFLGLCGGVGAVSAKLWLERNNRRSLDTCSQQLAMVKRQIEEAVEERDGLDEQLPRGGGTLLARLQAAEKELASLEDLLPLEARRQAAERESQAAEQAARQAETELATARRRWQDLLIELGLPVSVRPRQLRALAGFAAQWRDVVDKLSARQREVGDRRRALEALVTRIESVFAETKLEPVSTRMVERLRQLRQALADQAAIAARRGELRKRLRKLRRRNQRLQRLVAEYRLRRRTLLQLAGVDNEQDFLARATEQHETQRLQQELADVRAGLAAALTDPAGEESVRPWLEGSDEANLDSAGPQLAAELQEVEASIRQSFQHRGQLNEQLKQLAADRRPAEKRLEFDLLNERLAETIHRWRVLALTQRLLDEIREVYQRERQPATLQAASRFFRQMTGGRYVRVWTPLSEDRLIVDDDKGLSLPIELLSRGTREQLFLSLRLALVADYAARGQSFPLVLDDLLVNFDTERALATAQVLREFAAAGHQILLFTCHEHIRRLFQELGVGVWRLPSHWQGCATLTEEPIVLASTAQVLGVATLLPASSAVEFPAIAGESSSFRGWPVDEEIEEDLVTIPDHSSFWALVAHARPWTADGAEEFAGEFTERVNKEIRQPAPADQGGAAAGSRPRTAGRRRSAGEHANVPRSAAVRNAGSSMEIPDEGSPGEAAGRVWRDEKDQEAA